LYLETDRLIVRDLTLDDVDAVHRLIDLDIGYDDLTREQREQWLRWTVLNYAEMARLYQPPYGERGVALKATGELIGIVGLVATLMPFGLIEGFPGLAAGQAERRNIAAMGLYWLIGSAHQRQGYAAEAAGAVVRFAFSELCLHQIVATTEFDNEASIGVMRRLGMDILKNEMGAPFWLQVVGVLENRDCSPDWPAQP
jgi:[ribosomal protein S5]-alanine N-acetyltransferase